MAQSRQRSAWLWWTASGLLAVSIVVPGGYYLATSLAPGMANADEPEVGPGQGKDIHVEVVSPKKSFMERTSLQPGTVQSFESARLFAGVSGYLKTQTVDIGDRVKRGQVLATIDVPELEKQVERHRATLEQRRAGVKQMDARLVTAKAELEAAKAAVVQAQASAKSAAAALRFRNQQLQRMRDLFAQKAVDERLVDEKQEQRDAALEAELAAKAAILTANAQETAHVAKIQQADADIKEAEAEVKVAQADLEKAQVMVQFATIVSPYEGIITQRSLFPGDFVRAATEGGSQVPLLTVERTDKMRVIVQIPDRDVPFADAGDPAVVQIDALPGKTFNGSISRIAGSEDSQTRLMRVEIDLPNPTGKIRQGMYGRVTIVLDRTEMLSVPSASLVGKTEDGKGSVYVVRRGRAHLVPVQLGADNGIRVGILSGLRAEDVVIRHPGPELADGVAVIVPPSPTGR